ncbi:MAG: prenyltransferase [bacterium]
MATNTEKFRRFCQGERVIIRNSSGKVLKRTTVFARDPNFLHILVPSDDSLVNSLKYSKTVTIHSTRTLLDVEGQLSLIDHELNSYVDIDDDTGSDQYRLLQFRPGSSFDLTNKSPTPSHSLIDSISEWSELLHLNSLSATIIPIALGVVYAGWMNWPVSSLAAILALFGGVCLHVASNIHNELSDYHEAISRNGSAEQNLVNQKSIDPVYLWSTSISLYALSCLAGLPLLYWRGSELLTIGTIAFLIASYYCLFQHQSKNRVVIRDLSMFILTGPLMSVAASVAASGHYDWTLVAVSLPVGVFVALYLHEQEIYNIPFDRRAGATTLAMVLGFQWSKIYHLFLLFSGYAFITIMSLLGVIPQWTLLSYLSLPLAIRQLRLLQSIDSPLSPDMQRLRYSTRILQGLFGFFYLAGFLTEIYLW